MHPDEPAPLWIPPAPPDKSPNIEMYPRTNLDNIAPRNLEPVKLCDQSNTLNTSNYYAQHQVEPEQPPNVETPLNPSLDIQFDVNTDTQPQLNQLNVESETTASVKPSIMKLLKIPCYVNSNIHTTVMIDSGAGCNCISRSFVEEHNLEIMQSEPLTVTLADQTTTQSNHIVTVKLSLPSVNNLTFACVCIVLGSASHNLILGMNFLKTFNPIIDWEKQRIEIDMNKVKLNLQQNDSSTLNMLLSAYSVESSLTMITPTPRTSNTSKPLVQNHVTSPKTTSKVRSRLKVVPYHEILKLQTDPENELCTIFVTQNEFTGTPTETELPLNHIEVARPFNEHEERIIQEYKDVFAPIPKGLPPERTHDHRIELLPNSQPISKPAYRLAATELDELRRQLDKLLEHGHIRPSKSPYGSPVLFVKKKNGEMRMCVDYRALNNITVKNAYPLPRIDELLNRLSQARYFSKIDLASGYHQVRVSPDDVMKTAFRTRYGSYEFLVLPFGLCNAPSTFMHMMQDVLGEYLDVFVIVFLDDILIFSNNLEDHKQHVNFVLEKLRNNQLYAKLEKCEFMRKQIDFLGFTISESGLAMSEDKVKSILSWPTPTSVKQLRSFLGLAGFYRQFITMFSDTCSVLNELMKKESVFTWSSQHQTAFETLKQKISTRPTLILPRDELPFVVQTDASGFAIGGCLMQDHGRGLQPVAFLSKKLLPAETRYPTHEQELLAIIICLKSWRHYLYGKKFVVQTDHRSIIHFKTQQHMSNRQARWSEFLQQFDYDIVYKQGKDNVVADALSRRPDLETTGPLVLNQLAIDTTNADDSTSLNVMIRSLYPADPDCANILEALPSSSSTFEYRLNETGLILRKDNRILIPNDSNLKTKILQICHDDKTAGHVGTAKTIDLVTRRFYWKNLHRDVKEYVTSCVKCQMNKPSNQSQLGLLNPIPTPEQRWHTVTLDLITSLPRTKAGNDCIVVFVDKCSKLSHYAATVTNISAPKLGKLFTDNVVRLHGLPSNIISDRDPRFTSSFWRSVWKQLGTSLSMSTAFHPESDGQTERQNRTLEESLRHYTAYHQDDWDEHLSILELAHNNSIQASTGFSPFFLNSGQHPRMPMETSLGKDIQVNEAATTLLESLYQTLDLAHKNIEAAQLNQAKYANQHRRSFEPWKLGDKVMLSTANLKTPGRAPKLCPLWIGPFEIIRVLSTVTYELKLPSNMKIHPVFHVSHLKLFALNDKFRSRPVIDHRPPAVLLDDSDEAFEVEKILNKRGSGNRVQYLVKWLGYPEWESTWEPKSAFKYHSDKITEYENSQN